MSTTYTRAKHADIAEGEAKLNLHWTGPGCAADKYRADFFPIFGHGHWSWCAAFQRWCAIHAGLNVPIKDPDKFGFTFAYVPAWTRWAADLGFYHDNDGKFQPQRGDLVIYNWEQTSIDEPDRGHYDHIGIHLAMIGHDYQAAEGNTGGNGGYTALKNRPGRNIQGWIRIPDGFDFSPHLKKAA